MTITAPPEVGQDKQVGVARWRRWLAETDQPIFLYAFFVVLLGVFTISTPVFLTPGNLLNIVNQTALVTIMAMGVALVIITAEIDLSVGSTMALSGVCAALFMRDIANNWLLAAVIGLAVGALVGVVNGIVTVKLRIPSFLVTLGTLSVARGITLLITGTAPVLVPNVWFWVFFAEGRVAGIVAPILWSVLVVAVIWVLLHYGLFGRRLDLQALDLDAKARRRVVDQVAAAVMLQAWLDHRRLAGEPLRPRGSGSMSDRPPYDEDTDGDYEYDYGMMRPEDPDGSYDDDYLEDEPEDEYVEVRRASSGGRRLLVVLLVVLLVFGWCSGRRPVGATPARPPGASRANPGDW